MGHDIDPSDPPFVGCDLCIDDLPETLNVSVGGDVMPAHTGVLTQNPGDPSRFSGWIGVGGAPNELAGVHFCDGGNGKVTGSLTGVFGFVCVRWELDENNCDTRFTMHSGFCPMTFTVRE